MSTTKIIIAVVVAAMAITAILNRKTIYSELNRNPKFSDLWQFGLIFLVGMGAIGAAYHFYWKEPDVAQKLWILAGSVMVLSLIPPIGRLLYIVWMGFGLTLGFFTAPIIMGVVYFVVIMPVGIVFKIRHRDTMKRQLDPKAKSYWEDYPGSDDPGSYIRQF